MTPEGSHRTKDHLRLPPTAARERFQRAGCTVPVVLRRHPYQWHTKNDIARYEGYYASVFYSWFAAAGLDVRVEDSTSRGAAGHGGVIQ